VTPPIIRSTYNRIYSIWYWVDRDSSLYPPMTAGGSSSDTTTSTRCCKYSYMCPWWWVVSPPETCRAVCSNK